MPLENMPIIWVCLNTLEVLTMIMELSAVIELAKKHASEGEMASSARLCLEDAINLKAKRQDEMARCRALDSLHYSIGYFHEDYQRAAATK
jgi:hypothetical protein